MTKLSGKIFTNVILTDKQIEYLNRLESKEQGLLYPPERQTAKENNKKYYKSKQHYCGTYLRYVKNNKCIFCMNKKVKEWNERKVQKQKAA